MDWMIWKRSTLEKLKRWPKRLNTWKKWFRAWPTSSVSQTKEQAMESEEKGRKWMIKAGSSDWPAKKLTKGKID
jgi:hypothetical protein